MNKIEARSAFSRMPVYFIYMVFIFLISLWIRGAFPILAIANAAHDDLHFVNMASTIGAGNWLGEYNNLTHSKGIGYSLFLLANHVVGIPLKISEHAIYLLSTLYFSYVVGKAIAGRYLVAIIFTIVAFSPTAWIAESGGRVVREGLYVSLSVLLFTLTLHCFVLYKHVTLEKDLIEKRYLLLLLGIVTGLYWLTREEGVWLLPALLTMLIYWLWYWRGSLKVMSVSSQYFLLPFVTTLLIVGSINALNFYYYGVFRNNDFRSEDFKSAYGALSRIKHDQWMRYVIFPKDARERAYQFSSAAKELQTYFEGPPGEGWRQTGCSQTGITPCPEILSGWFMWTLRDAVASAGYYKSAQDAQRFYRRLALEIDTACELHPGECLPYRETMAPAWRDHYFLDTAKAAVKVFYTLVSFNNIPVGLSQSSGAAKQLALFALVTNGPLAQANAADAAGYPSPPTLESKRDRIRIALATASAKVEMHLAKVGVIAAVIGWIFWIAFSIWRRKITTALVICTALITAMITRVLLLGFLEATSIPSNNILYLFPVVPFTLALIPSIFFGIYTYSKK